MYKYFKTVFDLMIAILFLPIFLVIIILISLIILLVDGGPIFFSQRRFNKNGEYFNIIKFRTLKKEAQHNIPTNEYKQIDKFVTKTGKFLRKTSLDELPQILNILKGEMSFIGPRPLLWNQNELMRLRTLNGSSRLRPGITGLAQVSESAKTDDQEKIRYDGIYYQKLSFKLDLMIILFTIKIIFSRYTV
jgi:O-antigen biosynthesis protein WbqP